MTAQTIYNLEDPPPSRAPRVVKVDELAAFAEIYDVPVGDLLRPPEDVLAGEVAVLLEALGRHQRGLRREFAGFEEALRPLLLLVRDPQQLSRAIERAAELERLIGSLVDIGLDLEDEFRGAITSTTPPASRSRRKNRLGKHPEAP